MTTLRELIALGFDLDTEVLVQPVFNDTAYLADVEVRHVDEPSGRTVLVLSAGDAYVLLADEDDDELTVNQASDAQERVIHDLAPWDELEHKP